jgi:hypothetical protein
MSQCYQRNLRVLLTLHYTRQLQPADAPSWPCPSFAELTTIKRNYGDPAGGMPLWVWVDDGVAAFWDEFNQQLLTKVGTFTKVPIGKHPGLLCVLVTNEDSFVRSGPFGYSAAPVYQQLLYGWMQQFCPQVGVTWTGNSNCLNKVNLERFKVWRETTVLTQRVANLRQWTTALVSAGTYYGYQNCDTIKPQHDAGDVVDFHCYSSYAAGDPNHLQVQQGQVRSMWSAEAVACDYGDRPVICTEWGPQAQYQPFAIDSTPQADLAAVTAAGIAQNVKVLCYYAHAQSGFQPDPSYRTGPYDLCVNAPFLTGIRSYAAQFHDPDLRPTTSVPYSVTNAMLYGTGTGNAFTILSPQSSTFGPYQTPGRIIMTPTGN